MLIVPPCRASRRLATSRPLAIFYRFTVEEAIENGDRAARAGARPVAPVGAAPVASELAFLTQVALCEQEDDRLRVQALATNASTCADD
jgi:hypothetical protein